MLKLDIRQALIGAFRDQGITTRALHLKHEGQNLEELVKTTAAKK